MTPDELAEILYQAQKTKKACAPIRQYLPKKDIDTAYAIQQINLNRLLKQGRQIVGKKIGLTSKKVQAQLGVQQPDFGVLLDDMQLKNGEILSSSLLMQPKAEAEIAFVLKKDLTTSQITLTELINAIDYAVAAIEIVGSRIKNWDIQITDTIADNASSSHFVLGEKRIQLTQLDLENCRMQLHKNGQLVAEGTGKACLGNPLNAALWLAKKMNSLGNPLQKGEIILSGALGPMVSITTGDRIQAQITGLGSVCFAVD